MSDPEVDPRDIITPHAFRIAPELLGLPLASPWRRLAAAGLDALLITLLAQTPGWLLAGALAASTYGWMATQRRLSTRSTAVRYLVQSAAAVSVFLLGLLLIEPALKAAFADDEVSDDETSIELSAAQGLTLGVGIARLAGCDDAACREARLRTLASDQDSGMSPADRRQMLLDVIEDQGENDDERVRLRTVLDELLPPEAQTTATAVEMPAVAKPGPRLLDEAGRFSLLRTLETLADEIGLSIGWAALYFTVFTALWNGQTPAKRLLGLRVVHLSGKRLSYWIAFQRYGGYAAGFATGLLGFAEVFWDRNRQAIQDRIAFTAVIRLPR